MSKAVVDLVAVLRTCLHDALACLATTGPKAALHEAERGLLQVSELAPERFGVDHEASAQVQNIVFFGLLSLQRRAAALEAASGAQETSEAIAGVRREIIKAATALTSAITALDNAAFEPPQAYSEELKRSLAIRLAYARLRSHLLRDVNVNDDAALLTWLRHAGTSLTVLRSQPIHDALRLDDRLLIEQLHQRVLAWVREVRTSGAESMLAARRLHTDLRGFGHLLDNVNNRSELRDHDAAVLRRVLAEPDVSVQRALLEEIRGRDLTLDAALDAGSDAATITPMLTMLASRLGLAERPAYTITDDFF